MIASTPSTEKDAKPSECDNAVFAGFPLVGTAACAVNFKAWIRRKSSYMMTDVTPNPTTHPDSTPHWWRCSR
jgi:hypothetical protein